MTGNSRQVILPREMVELVLVGAAANRIARSDRRMPINLPIVFTRRVYRSMFKMSDDFNPDPRFYRLTINITALRRILLGCKAIGRILRKKVLLLRRNIAIIKTIVITSASYPAIFESSALL